MLPLQHCLLLGVEAWLLPGAPLLLLLLLLLQLPTHTARGRQLHVVDLRILHGNRCSSSKNLCLLLLQHSRVCPAACTGLLHSAQSRRWLSSWLYIHKHPGRVAQLPTPR
jgi:hypothetical protein